ncbi:hypothetical protein PR048_018351 [Dryococelus australis]|uniref:Uncharacterized protein n=1 Tax=Dryococelus australis TaxID=614101 RepID=A0ABQ9HC04_9NEOP|nr:hypothetical protein PR048_018351 [Dryococelus australis]
MRVIEVYMKQGRNGQGKWKTAEINPLTNGIVRHYSHMRRSGVTRPGIEPGSQWWEASRLTASHRGPTWPSLSSLSYSCKRALPVKSRGKVQGGQEREGEREREGRETDREQTPPGMTPHGTQFMTGRVTSYTRRPLLGLVIAVRTGCSGHAPPPPTNDRLPWPPSLLDDLHQVAGNPWEALSVATTDGATGGTLTAIYSTLSIQRFMLANKTWRRGIRETHEKTRRPTASSGTIHNCEDPMTPPGIELDPPWWGASGNGHSGIRDAEIGFGFGRTAIMLRHPTTILDIIDLLILTKCSNTTKMNCENEVPSFDFGDHRASTSITANWLLLVNILQSSFHLCPRNACWRERTSAGVSLSISHNRNLSINLTTHKDATHTPILILISILIKTPNLQSIFSNHHHNRKPPPPLPRPPPQSGVIMGQWVMGHYGVDGINGSIGSMGSMGQ